MTSIGSVVCCAALLFLPYLSLQSQTIPPASMTISGEASDNFGWSVSGVGDMNNDGIDDLLVGAPASPALAGFAGRAFLFFGPLDGNLMSTDADVIFNPDGAFGDNFGISVTNAGDVNNDGNNDILIGARSSDAGGIQSGKAYLYDGPFSSGTILPGDADAVFIGNAFDELGWSTAAAGDVNNDGIDDILLGCPQALTGLGRVLLFHGPLTGTYTPSDADASIQGEIADERLGSSVAGTGDMNGDGFDDLVIGQFSPLIPVPNNGRALVFYGPVSGTLPASAADAQIIGEVIDDRLGISVSGVGDINGDGKSDILLGADQFWSGDRGKAYLFHGPVTGIVSASSAAVTIRGERAGDQFGTTVRGAGDLNGDQVPDIIVGAATGGNSGSGSGYLFFGPLNGNISAAEADLILEEEAGGGWFGNSLSATGDLDDDGTADIAVGAPLSDFAASDAGQVYLFSVAGQGVPCEHILRFRAKCKSNGRLLIGANLVPGSGHDGKSIVFLVDGTQHVSAGVAGDFARAEVQVVASVSHTVEMTDPAGCLPPVIATCTGSGELTLDVQESELAPLSTSLLQNYPNPFNAETVFGFQVSNDGPVTLEIFDVLGNRVASLANEKLVTGSYTRKWNAAGLPSGVYYSRLQTDGMVEIRKVMLLR